MSVNSGSAATRLRLLSAAAEEFTERGYVGASLASIAARLGLTKGAFAHHYPTKRALLEDLHAANMDMLGAARDAALREHPEGGIAGLVAFLGEIGHRSETDAIGACFVTLATDLGISAEGVPEIYTTWIEYTIGFLESAVLLGQLDSDDLYEDAEHIITSTIGVGLYLERRPERALANPQRFLKLVFAGIGVRDVDALVASGIAPGREFALLGASQRP